MKAKFVVFSVCVLLTLVINTPPSFSENGKITDQLILQQNKEMEKHLQARDPMETIKFMHHHIADSAEFQISYNNEFIPENNTTQKISMDKKDYINSFIQGLNYVSDYKINIETNSINISKNGAYAIAEETISEEGIMLNPEEPKAQGITFKSQTSCKKFYKLENGVALSDKAECTTATTKTDAV